MSLFSTTGVRGLANKDMSPEFVLALCKAFGTFLGAGKWVLVARDTRTSSEMLARAAVSGLLSAGLQVFDTGVVPIPVLSRVTREDYDAGVMITSSHNPAEYNGLKFILSDGVEISTKEEEAIENVFTTKKFFQAPWKDISPVVSRVDALVSYTQAAQRLTDLQSTRTANLHVVVDPGNGGQSVLIAPLLESLGCRVTAIHDEPKGIFERSPEPKDESLGELKKRVQSESADLGVAFDIDGDRAIFCTAEGKILMGDVTGTLLARATYQKHPGPIVTTIATSRVLDDVASKVGAKVFKTAVGAKFVGEKMQTENACFGFEENGGCVFPDLSYTRDGSFTAVKLVELLATEKKPLHELVKTLPKYFQVKGKIDCPDAKKGSVMATVAREFKSQKPLLVDGVKVEYPDASLLVRASGTEPIIRVFAEAQDTERANELLKEGLAVAAAEV